ncbi:MAG: SH3 domain-containing protein [Pseudomonadota bacterium]
MAAAQSSEMPHWRTLRFDEVNMRVGPSREYKIEWVYKREGLPVVVLRQRDGWLYVRDHEGTLGWVAASQTTSRLGGMIMGDGLADLRAEPSATSEIKWRAQPGVVGRINECTQDHCELDVEGRIGWVAIDRLWGVGEIELEG